MADVEREFVAITSPTARQHPVGAHPCQGLWSRAAGSRPSTALIATHYNGDMSQHYLAPYMAERGYGFLGWNTRFRGAEDVFLLEHALVDVGAGVRWLREEQGVQTVVLLGNSGGGSLMAAYQSQATKPGLEPTPGTTLPDAVNELLPADLFISLNAHPGRPEVYTAWLDPSVSDESDPLATDASLDMYDDANGPPYTLEFVERYRAAQGERNRRITAWVRAELERLAAHGYRDRVFPIYRLWADLRFMDPSIDPSERPPRSCYAGDPKRANRGAMGLGRTSTLRTWLSMWSLEYSQCRGKPHFEKLEIPALVVQSMADAGVFPSDARQIYEALGSADKSLEFIKGAHYLETPKDARAKAAELLSGWLSARV